MNAPVKSGIRLGINYMGMLALCYMYADGHVI